MIQKIKCWFGFHRMNDVEALLLIISGDVTEHHSRCKFCNKYVRFV